MNSPDASSSASDSPLSCLTHEERENNPNRPSISTMSDNQQDARALGSLERTDMHTLDRVPALICALMHMYDDSSQPAMMACSERSRQYMARQK